MANIAENIPVYIILNGYYHFRGKSAHHDWISIDKMNEASLFNIL